MRRDKGNNIKTTFKSYIFVIILFSILLATFNYIPLGPVDVAEAGKFGNIVPTSFELALMDKINENRSSNGAGPVFLNTSLWWVARAHCQDMIDQDFFDHTSSQDGPFNGATFSQRVWNYADYDGSAVGECIAWNSWGPDPEWCMSTWKGSSGHWSIIIDPKYTELGLGIIQGNYNGWSNSAMYTADFGKVTLSVDLALDVSDIELTPSSPQQGDIVTIIVNVHNLGATDAYPVFVKVYDGDPDLGGVLIGSEITIPHILINEEAAQVNVTWDTDGLYGDHDIYVVIDPDNTVQESDDGNNRAQKTISLGSPPNPPIHLSQGWNLASFPFEVNDTGLTNVLASILGEYDIVQSYAPGDSQGPWRTFNVQKPSSLNDLAILDNKRGFWIHVTNPEGADLVVEGAEPQSPRNVPMTKGWNLVGYPSLTGKIRNTALNNLQFGDQIDVIQYYDDASGNFVNVGSGDSFLPEKGYFIHSTQDCEWIVN